MDHIQNKARGHWTLGALLLAICFAIACLALPAGATDTTSRLLDRSELNASTGTAAITTTAADFTTWQTMLTIAPDPQHAIHDVRVVIDLDKTTTGFASTYTSGTITFSIARKVDGTNWRTCTNLATTAISGTNSTALMIELNVGSVGPNEGIRVMWKVSAESNSNTSFPYVVYYRSGVRATFTAAS